MKPGSGSAAASTAKAELVAARMNKELETIIERNAAVIERCNTSFEKTVVSA